MPYVSPPSSATDVASGATVATVDGTANTLSRDVVGNKSDAAVTTVGTVASLLAYVKGLLNNVAKPAADSVANVTIADVLGSKDDTSQTSGNNTRSIVAYAKGTLAFLAVPSADSALTTQLNTTIGHKNDTPPASSTVAAAGSALANGGIAGWLKGLWNATYKKQAVTNFNNAALNTSETTMLDVGATTGTQSHRLDGAVCNIATLGTGTTTYTFRLYTVINGVLTLTTTTTKTATGAFNLANAFGSPIGSQEVKITVQRDGAMSDGSVSATFETSKGSA